MEPRVRNALLIATAVVVAWVSWWYRDRSHSDTIREPMTFTVSRDIATFHGASSVYGDSVRYQTSDPNILTTMRTTVSAPSLRYGAA